MLRLRMLLMQMLDVAEKTIEMALGDQAIKPMFKGRLQELMVEKRGSIAHFSQPLLDALIDDVAALADVELLRRREARTAAELQEAKEREASKAYERGYHEGIENERNRIAEAILGIIGPRPRNADSAGGLVDGRPDWKPITQERTQEVRPGPALRESNLARELRQQEERRETLGTKGPELR